MSEKGKPTCGFWCDEYTETDDEHKGQGYCWERSKPTSPELLEECRKDLLAEIGPICFHCCPFIDDLDGYNCDDPGVSDILACTLFNEALNRALGGAEEWEYEYFFDHGFAYYRGAPLP